MIAMTIPDDWLPYIFLFNLEFELLVFNSSSRCTTDPSFVFPKFELRKKHEEQNRGDLNFENLEFERKGIPRYFLGTNCADADV